MATYIIGDVQGCYQELQELLQTIDFNPDTDKLAFVGDIVNRGPNSLEVLRFIKQLKNPWVVLGNHDLFLLIIGYELMPTDAYEHTLDAVLRAPDKQDLIEWLRHQPLIHAENQALLVHAGLPPQWNVEESLQYAEEVAAILQGPNFQKFLTHLFGDEPSTWSNSLNEQDRWRYITNALTRMRFCSEAGELDLSANGKMSTSSKKYHPWFDWRDPNQDEIDIYFGHWAALNGECNAPRCYALDTGCAWGHCLTALRLDDKKRFKVPCHSSLRM